MARDLTVMELLAALVATNNLDLPDTVAIHEFTDHVNVLFHEPPGTLEEALDIALDFFCDDPDTEAAKQVERVQASQAACERGVCPDCGEPSMMDAVDDEQSVDLWMAVRGIVDKYMWDQMQIMHDHGPEAEEC